MSGFPTLKTGAVAQYPADRATRYATQVYRFLDGAEQRFPAFGTQLHQWTIRLDLLDEAELSALGAYFVSEEGQAGDFSFTDPWDSTVYPSCSFASDSFAMELKGPHAGAVELVVTENRS